MSKYIIRVNSASEYPQDINSAFVDVTDDLHKTIAARRLVFNLAKKEDSTLYSMRYWCGEPLFYEMSEDDEEVFQEGSMLADDDLLFESKRVECVTMVVTEEGVSWTCYEKHCDVELRTDILGYVVLEETAE